MGAKVRIEHVSEGWRTILCGGEMQGVVDSVGSEIIGSCESISGLYGDYAYRGRHFDYGGGRVGAYVQLDSLEARIDEARNKTLERAVSGL